MHPHLWSEHKIRRIVMAVDMISMSAAFVLSYWLRHRNMFGTRFGQFYYIALFLILFIYLFLSTYRRVKKKEHSLTEMDAADNLMDLIRGRLEQYVILIILLALSGSFAMLSRRVLAYTVVLDVVFSYMGRMAVRHFLRRSQNSIAPSKYYYIVTKQALASTARERLNEILPADGAYAGTICVDEGAELFSEKELYVRLDQGLCHCSRKTGGKACLFVYLNGVGTCLGKSVSEETTPGEHRYLHSEGVSGITGREQTYVSAVIRFGREHAIPVVVRQFSDGQELPISMIESEGRYATTVYEPALSAGEVLGVRFVPSNVEEAAFIVLDTMTGEEQAGNLTGQYICFSNVHTTVMAREDAAYREILNGAAFTFADGMPIARQLRREGFEKCTRVAGPDFMDAVFRATMDGAVSHYFYGSTQETIDHLCEELQKRYPGIRIAGAVSPPFRPETAEEDAASIAAINASGAAFVWIGLGAPKQEKWMAAHRGQIDGVMFGVGAGFNFFAGTVKRAPKWIQKLGFEWFYRFLQDPRRLANRYVVTNAKYLWYMLSGKTHGFS